LKQQAAVTICICTRNRAGLLPDVLEDLAAQSRSVALPWALLVVDNGSTDATTQVLEEHGARLPIKGVFEPRAGLSVARNRALQEAATPAIVFTDDDVRLGAGWLAAWAHALENDEDHGWFGGRVEPAWPTQRPRWLLDERLDLLSGVLGSHALPNATQEYGPNDPLPIGANFAVKTRVARELGGFREDLGVKGESRGRGEETEWLLRARRAGHRGLHVGAAVVRHPVPPERLRLGALWEHGVESGIAHARIHGMTRAGSRFRSASFLVRGARQWLLGRGDRFRQCVINAGIEAGLRRASRERQSPDPTAGDGTAGV
jgi:glucosyl-dolichyl phosphate glucuronosyltransferase